MKKAICVFMLFVLCFTLFGCAGQASTQKDPEKADFLSKAADSVKSEVPSESETEAPSETETEVPEDPDIAYVITEDGELETLSGRELLEIRDENAVRFKKHYIGAYVIVISDVAKISSDKKVTLEESSFNCSCAVSLSGKWCFGIPKFNTEVEDLRKGDRVIAAGVISGYSKTDGLAIMQNAVAYSFICPYRDDMEHSEDYALKCVKESGSHYCFYASCRFFKAFQTLNPEASLGKVHDEIDAQLSRCYDNSFVLRFEEWCNLPKGKQIQKVGTKVYYDVPVANTAAANTYAQSYIKYLQAFGFKAGENVMEYYDGDSYDNAFEAVPLKSDVLGTVMIALGDKFVRIIVDVSKATNITIYYIP